MRGLAPEEFRNWKRGAAAMATVRFYRGHWVADYYDTNKRRRIERPKGHFENLTDQWTNCAPLKRSSQIASPR